MAEQTEEEKAFWAKYPESVKLKEASKTSNIIGEFLDVGGYVLAEYVSNEASGLDHLVPVASSIEEVLAKYFEVDMKKVEQERRQMLKELAG